jgi:hypothetical protein
VLISSSKKQNRYQCGCRSFRAITRTLFSNSAQNLVCTVRATRKRPGHSTEHPCRTGRTALDVWKGNGFDPVSKNPTTLTSGGELRNTAALQKTHLRFSTKDRFSSRLAPCLKEWPGAQGRTCVRRALDALPNILRLASTCTTQSIFSQGPEYYAQNSYDHSNSHTYTDHNLDAFGLLRLLTPFPTLTVTKCKRKATRKHLKQNEKRGDELVRAS